MEVAGLDNVAARRVIDDLMEISGETSAPKYMKFFLLQKLAATRHFVRRMRSEADAIRSCIDHMATVIVELQGMENQDEVYDSLLVAKKVKSSEETQLLALNEVIAEALEQIVGQENNVKMLDGNHDSV